MGKPFQVSSELSSANIFALVMDLRDRFQSEIDKTSRKIAQYKDMTQPVAPDDAIGRVSRMDAINNKGVMEAALRKARQRLEGLQRHLERLETDEFGRCIKCHSEIPIERIFMAPQSSFCVNCARK